MTAIPKSTRQKLDREIAAITKLFLTKDKKAGKMPLSYTDFFADKMLLIRIIREGVPWSFFHAVQEFMPFSEADWAQLLDVSAKALQRYRQQELHFRPVHAEKIIEMAEVTHAGLEVFAGREKFRLWLDTPNYALGNLKPLELLKDSYGKEMVLGELVRINHGILA